MSLIRKFMLALALCAACPVAATPVLAQEEAAPVEGGDSSGRPVDGYIVTSILAFLALFLVAKSARR